MKKKVVINKRSIGAGYPCYVILEAGVNFGDMDGAKALIDSAVRIGADCVKFQTFHAGTTVARGAKLKDARGTVDQYEEFMESENKQTEYFQKGLFSYAGKRKITAFSTPSHFKDVDLLEKIADPPAYKVGSDDLTNIPLLRYIARLGKPVLISTGASYMQEITNAVRAVRGEGNDEIILLHCVSQYPAQPEDMNLKVMGTLEKEFRVPVGLSDHTMTTSIPLAACALGAAVIEKHYTLDRYSPGPDNFFSMLPNEMESVIKGVREIESAMGDARKRVIAAESRMRLVFKKSIHAVRDIEKGEPITKQNIDILRPAGGIEPASIARLYGMKARKNIPAGKPVTWEAVGQ